MVRKFCFSTVSVKEKPRSSYSAAACVHIAVVFITASCCVVFVCVCVCVCVLCFHWWGMLQIKERNNKPVSPFTYSPIVITIMP